VRLARHLDAWTAAQPYTPHVHSGDVGLRSGADAVDGTLLAWDVDGTPVAAGLLDAGVLRLVLAPGWSASTDLATRVAAQCADLAYGDALSGTALRQQLLATGWSADPDPWVVLHKDLGAADADHDDPRSRARAGAGGIRVHTPASNEAAVRAHESCGLRRVDVTTAVTRVG